MIGAINTQGGQVLVGPNWTKGAELARPVRQHATSAASRVTRSSSASASRPPRRKTGTKCGQKFANDKRISVVEFGAVAVGNQSFYAALGGKKPIVSGVALLPVDATQKNEFALFGTNDSVLGPWGTFAKTKLHAKTAAVDLPAGAGDRRRRQGREDEPRGRRDHDEARRLRPERDRPDRPADRGRRADGRHRRPAEQRRRLRQRRQDAAAARRLRLQDRLEPALPERRGRGGPRRRPRAVGLRHRLDARRRQVGPGGRPLQQGDEAKLGQSKLARRRLGDRLLGPGPHDREDDEPDRRREADVREVHDDDQGVQGPAGARRAEPAAAGSTRPSLRPATTRRSSSSTRARASSRPSAAGCGRRANFTPQG